MKKAFVFLADGFEIVEAMATVDMLVRGGADLKLVSVSGDNVVDSAQGIPVIAEYLLKEVPVEDKLFAGDEFVSVSDIGKEDIMIFPGGMPGTRNLAECKPLMDKMKSHYAEGGCVAAICAAPGLVLSQLPLDETVRRNGSLKMTCYEGFEPALEAKGVTVIDQRQGVVVDGNIVTASGPGHAVDFGLEILRLIKGETVAQETRRQLML